jgi:hypothetical protein
MLFIRYKFKITLVNGQVHGTLIQTHTHTQSHIHTDTASKWLYFQEYNKLCAHFRSALTNFVYWSGVRSVGEILKKKWNKMYDSRIRSERQKKKIKTYTARTIQNYQHQTIEFLSAFLFVCLLFVWHSTIHTRHSTMWYYTHRRESACNRCTRH